MEMIKIILTDVNDIKEFVAEAAKVVGEVTMKRNPYVVDGKSILGVMSLVTYKGVWVEYPVEEIAFGEYLKTKAVV